MVSQPKYNPAAKSIASTFGVLGGLGGMVHGVGEVLQGDITTGGFSYNPGQKAQLPFTWVGIRP